MFLLSYDKIYCLVGAFVSCDQNQKCTGKEKYENTDEYQYRDFRISW